VRTDLARQEGLIRAVFGATMMAPVEISSASVGAEITAQ